MCVERVTPIVLAEGFFKLGSKQFGIRDFFLGVFLSRVAFGLDCFDILLEALAFGSILVLLPSSLLHIEYLFLPALAFLRRALQGFRPYVRLCFSSATGDLLQPTVRASAQDLVFVGE